MIQSEQDKNSIGLVVSEYAIFPVAAILNNLYPKNGLTNSFSSDDCIQNGCQYNAITARESETLILRSNHLQQPSKYLHSTSELFTDSDRFGVEPGWSHYACAVVVVVPRDWSARRRVAVLVQLKARDHVVKRRHLLAVTDCTNPLH